MISIPSFPSLQQTRVFHRGLALCAALTFSPVQAADADVVAFTDAQHPVENASGARVVRLDAAAHLESALSAQLPADAAQAEAVVRRRLAQGGAESQRQLTTAYQGIADAWGMGIAKIPAVVVDHRYVVYGDADIVRAVARINAWRNSRP